MHFSAWHRIWGRSGGELGNGAEMVLKPLNTACERGAKQRGLKSAINTTFLRETDPPSVVYVPFGV